MKTITVFPESHGAEAPRFNLKKTAVLFPIFATREERGENAFWRVAVWMKVGDTTAKIAWKKFRQQEKKKKKIRHREKPCLAGTLKTFANVVCKKFRQQQKIRRLQSE